MKATSARPAGITIFSSALTRRWVLRIWTARRITLVSVCPRRAIRARTSRKARKASSRAPLVS